MPMPLEGIRVLDWTIFQQGPVAASMLGDLGADVIKIEQRGVGDPGRGVTRVRGVSVELPGGRSAYIEANNRNKRSIAIDLNKEEGKRIVYRLVEKSDVFVQNFRKGVAARRGLDWATLHKYNSKLVYASGSAFGPEGPDSREPGMDLLGLARSGMMLSMGEENTPPQGVVGGISDQMGAIILAYGVVIALLARERYGVGQEVDGSLLGGMMMLQGLHVSLFSLLNQDTPRDNRSANANPLWNHYKCKDGRWLALAHLQSDRYWEPLCRALGLEELASDPRFMNMLAREKHAPEIIAILDQVFANRTAAEWMSELKAKGDFICTVVFSMNDVVNDPQNLDNGYIQEMDHPVMGKTRVLGIPVTLSRTPGSIRLPAPEMGQHTEEVLLEIGGYTWDEIDRLKNDEVI